MLNSTNEFWLYDPQMTAVVHGYHSDDMLQLFFDWKFHYNDQVYFALNIFKNESDIKDQSITRKSERTQRRHHNLTRNQITIHCQISTTPLESVSQTTSSWKIWYLEKYDIILSVRLHWVRRSLEDCLQRRDISLAVFWFLQYSPDI